MQHKALELVLLEEQVQALHVFLRTERERGERLRFASRDERGAMDAREPAAPAARS